MKSATSLRILDCTLRDGGFYNNWDFDENLIKSYLNVISESGVDVAEIGYRSIVSSGFYGLLKYSGDKQLTFLSDFKKLEYSIMVDLKEFVTNNVFDRGLFSRTFRRHENTNVTWIRLAIIHDLLRFCKEALGILKDFGYRTTVNLMQISLLGGEQIKNAAGTLSECALDVFYFADSFGSMMPRDVKKYLGLIRENYGGQIGAHFHDNLGLAFSNSLEAIECNVDYLDSTVQGIGRGAGNVKTEVLLLYLKIARRMNQYNPNVLLGFVDRYMRDLKNQYQWGASFNYALSGLKNIHPMYCQKLEELGRYSSDKFISILENIPDECKSRYSSKELEKAIVEAQRAGAPHEEIESIDLKKTFGKHEEVFLIGTGPSSKKYLKALEEYVETKTPFVIECNIGMGLSCRKGFATLIHEKHLLENKVERFQQPIVLGNPGLFKSSNIASAKYFFKYKITPNRFEVTESEIGIPFEVVSMYALGLALLLEPKRILLAGFDGYQDHLDVASNYIKQQEMVEFFSLFLRETKEARVELFSTTPTSYQIPTKSIYHLLSRFSDGI